MTTTEILDRRESSGMTNIARYDIKTDGDGERWNREDRRLLRKFLLSCFRAERMVDKATAEIGDRHERKFTLRIDDEGMRVTMARKIRLNSIWRGFWHARVELVEATRV